MKHKKKKKPEKKKHVVSKDSSQGTLLFRCIHRHSGPHSGSLRR